ncbi:MAG TPA: pyrroline-5-carboxylate reductase [Dissulfurispiraceae bacterium]|nr:pyrroline-5-carboxylate reductase [Dissulfurispiraceae bacterium]
MIGFIGGGKMAEALIKGISSKGNNNIFVSEPLQERRLFLQSEYRIKSTASNKEVADACRIIILAVKPQNMAAVLDDIAASITGENIVVSIAAGITLTFLRERLKTGKLVRVMPNTPALVQEGMSVLSLCECFSEQDITAVREIFMSVGKVLTLPEKYMNAVTALSGSGPAFIALFTEALVAAGHRMGLAREHATELALQTLIGTARLLETGMPPEKLREMVTSPGGTTAAGLKTFEERELKNIVADALQAALKRAEELGGGN